jgi:undecaprenyl-diphosphatase
MAEACTQGIDTGFVALGYGKVAVLGIVQGITELLPISSTAHMRVVPALLGWQDPGSAFSAAMQLAALAAVVSYFWSDVRQLVFGSLAAVARGEFRDPYLRLAIWIVLATIPIAVAGLALAGVLNTCNSPLRGLSVIGWACIVMAILLALAEVRARHLRTLEQGTFVDAMLVGLAQVGALIPGVSRSGSTLTAALALGFKRDEAARFSFLLGLPAIALAGFKELHELRHAGLDPHGWAVLCVGLIVASLSAFVAIWGLLRILERFSAWPFAVYRALIGALLLIGVASGWLG